MPPIVKNALTPLTRPLQNVPKVEMPADPATRTQGNVGPNQSINFPMSFAKGPASQPATSQGYYVDANNRIQVFNKTQKSNAGVVPPTGPSSQIAPPAQQTSSGTPGTSVGNVTTGGSTAAVTAAQEYASRVNDASRQVRDNAIATSGEPTIDGTTQAADGSSGYYLDQIKMLAEQQPEKPQSMATLYDTLREQYGLDDEMAEFVAANEELRMAEAGRDISIQDAKRETSTTGREDVARSFIGREFSDTQRILLARKQAAADAMQAKMTTISEIMKWTGEDYDNTRQWYNDQFTRANSMYDTIFGAEQASQNKARANWTTALNAINESGVNINDVDPAMKTNLKQWAMQSGLPADFPEFLASLPKKQEMAFHTTGYDDDGNQTVTVFYKNPDGTIGAPSTFKTGARSQSSSTTKSILFTPEKQRDMLSLGITKDVQDVVEEFAKGGRPDLVLNPVNLPESEAKKRLLSMGPIQYANLVKTLVQDTHSPQDAAEMLKPFISYKLSEAATGKLDDKGNDTGRQAFINNLYSTLPKTERDRLKDNFEDEIFFGDFGRADWRTQGGADNNVDNAVNAIAYSLFDVDVNDMELGNDAGLTGF